MKFTILPENKASRTRLYILIILFAALAIITRLDRIVWYVLADKQQGDIVFQSLPHGELVDAIETITESPWSHCGILVKRDGRWYVAEALGDVRYTPYLWWVLRGRGHKVESYRVKDVEINDINELLDEIDKLVGKKYDLEYAPDDSEIYCSELVYKTYDRAYSIKIGQWQKLGDLNWKPKETFIRSVQHQKLPLDREMITPVALTRSNIVKQVF